MIQPQTVYNPAFPQIPKDGRFMFFGNESKHYGYVVYNLYYLLSGMQENENIQGWYVQNQASAGSSSLYSINKLNYGAQLLNFSEGNEENYYKIMKAGWVNYFVFDSDDTTFIKFFNNSRFKTYSADDRFIVKEMVPKAKYVEVNGKDEDTDFEKDVDVININMTCKPGTITVKERYDKNWKVTLNGKDITPSENEYGFIKFENKQSGACEIILKYENQPYEKIFFIMSIVSLTVAVVYFLYDLKKHPEVAH
jgi:uncharacterized membrane protein YfhO